MVKSEKLSKLTLTVGFMLAVFLFAIFMLSSAANADEPEPVAEAVPVEEAAADQVVVPGESYALESADVPSVTSIDEGLIALHNVEYDGPNKINFKLCLHGYELLPADATVTVTAYTPVTNTIFYRSTFTKDYLAFKAAANITGGTTDGAILNLPAVRVLKIEVNGTDIDGWDLIYGSTVEEAIIWNPSSGMTGVAADYVPGNATYFLMSNIGGQIVHLGIDGANPNPPSGGGDDNDPSGPSGGGDDNDPSGPSGGGDDNDPSGPSGGGDDNDPNGPSGGSDDNDPNGPSGGGDDNDPNDPSDNSKDDNNDGGKKEPAKTGDIRSTALMSVIAVISLTVLTATFRKKEDN